MKLNFMLYTLILLEFIILSSCDTQKGKNEIKELKNSDNKEALSNNKLKGLQNNIQTATENTNNQSKIGKDQSNRDLENNRKRFRQREEQKGVKRKNTNKRKKAKQKVIRKGPKKNYKKKTKLNRKKIRNKKRFRG